ncbi:MAG: hypothetical protein A2Y73_03860 [Chloroflexi bacterium RBG_13_56_8]|nr:MAG: hypothetical protein A2Y73_03860 [Chloroflexi bacterium RBG_13_56_8]
MPFEVGNRVVHPAHGAGTIIGIQKANIGEASHMYYVIKAISNSMQLMVPVGQANDIGLRRVGQARKLRGTLKQTNAGEIEKNHTIRHKEMLERIKSGHFAEVAGVVCTLLCMSTQRALGKVDREIFNKGKELLAGELALATDSEMRLAMQEIEESLARNTEQEEA